MSECHKLASIKNTSQNNTLILESQCMLIINDPNVYSSFWLTRDLDTAASNMTGLPPYCVIHSEVFL